MKVRFFSRWLTAPIVLASIAVGITISPLKVHAADSEAQELRARAEKIQQKARELAADGQMERALQARREADELLAKAEGLGAAGRPAAERPEAPQPEELRRKLRSAMAELQELRAAGKQDQAAELKGSIQKMEQQLARLEESSPARRLGGGARGTLRTPPPREFAGPGPEGPGLPERLRHLEIAIDNLRAAGMEEPADRLAQAAERLRQQLRTRGPNPDGMRPPGPPEAEIDRLRGEVQELRQAVRELREQVGRLSAERR